VKSLEEKVRQFCAEHGVKLKKSLGQNFLIDEEVLEKIVSAANIQSDDHIIEIGPGIGILTAQLLKKAKKVTAIELDRTLVPLLKEYVARNQKPACVELTCGELGRTRRDETRNQLTIIQDNALRVPFPKTPYKIVANIPYHITSPLLRHAFMESPTPPYSLTLLLQREVAEKICDTESAGILTILVHLFGKPEVIVTVPPKSFLPPPKVDSAVLHVECFSQPLADKETLEQVFRLVKIAFSQKRKMLRNTLGAFPGGGELLSALKIDEKRRPQTLFVEEWLEMAKKSKEYLGDA